jgi:4-amino-4-deoxy-L-arabinose transferase-like glycosyltransferase
MHPTSNTSPATDDRDGGLRGRVTLLFGGVALIYAVLLIVGLPHAPFDVNGFSHDSAYVDRLVRNLLAGRGFVNDALWPVFLKPAAIPLPFHNQNPLYALAIALVAPLASGDTGLAGFIVSAAADAAILWALATLAFERLGLGLGESLIVGATGALFPTVFSTGGRYLPDAMCAAGLLWCFVWTCRKARWAPVMAGVFFGIAWLTRSTAVLALPTIGIFMLVDRGFRRTLVDGAVMGVAALVVASPWLVYTAQVWGSPFRSDGPFSLVAEFQARLAYGGEQQRYWHSLPTPPRLRGLIASHPTEWLSFYLHSFPPLLRAIVGGLANGIVGPGSYVALVAICVLAAFGGWRLWSTRSSLSRQDRGIMLAFAMFVATNLAFFALLGGSIELRYLCAMNALVAATLAVVAVRAARMVRSGGMGSQRLATMVVVVAAVGAALALREDARIRRFQRKPNGGTVAYYALARRMSIGAPGNDPVVVGDVPYFFNLATDRRALSIPWSTDEELRAYMTRYGSRHVLLTGDEQKFWRPSWTSDAAVPAFLRVAARDSSATLYELTSATAPRTGAALPVR